MIPTAGEMFEMEDSLIAIGMAEENILSVEVPTGSHNNCFWKNEFKAAYLWLCQPVINSVEEQSEEEINIQLFPNPTNNAFTLDFNLLNPANIHIDLFEISGRRHSILLQQNLSAGSHRLEFNCKDLSLAPGIYFCRIESENTSSTVKLIVEE